MTARALVNIANAAGFPAGLPIAVDDLGTARMIGACLEDEATRMFRRASTCAYASTARKELDAGLALVAIARQLAIAAGEPDYIPPTAMTLERLEADRHVARIQRAARQ